MSNKKPALTPQQTTIGALVEDAYSVFSTLADEMREAFDNTPENLQASAVGQARSDAADALENCIDAPEIPDSVKDVPATFTPAPQNRLRSRAAQRDEAAAMLHTAIEGIESKLVGMRAEQENLTADGDTTPEREGEAEAIEDAIGELEEARDEIQNGLDEAEGVEFPGMYG